MRVSLVLFSLLAIFVVIGICENWHQKHVRLNAADPKVDPHILEYAETVLSLYGLRNAVGELTADDSGYIRFHYQAHGEILQWAQLKIFFGNSVRVAAANARVGVTVLRDEFEKNKYWKLFEESGPTAVVYAWKNKQFHSEL